MFITFEKEAAFALTAVILCGGQSKFFPRIRLSPTFLLTILDYEVFLDYQSCFCWGAGKTLFSGASLFPNETCAGLKVK